MFSIIYEWLYNNNLELVAAFVIFVPIIMLVVFGLSQLVDYVYHRVVEAIKTRHSTKTAIVAQTDTVALDEWTRYMSDPEAFWKEV